MLKFLPFFLLVRNARRPTVTRDTRHVLSRGKGFFFFFFAFPAGLLSRMPQFDLTSQCLALIHALFVAYGVAYITLVAASLLLVFAHCAGLCPTLLLHFQNQWAEHPVPHPLHPTYPVRPSPSGSASPMA